MKSENGRKCCNSSEISNLIGFSDSIKFNQIYGTNLEVFPMGLVQSIFRC